ncbi:MAG: hypothetical protein WCI72_03935 [archaeon]
MVNYESKKPKAHGEAQPNVEKISLEAKLRKLLDGDEKTENRKQTPVNHKIKADTPKNGNAKQVSPSKEIPLEKETAESSLPSSRPTSFASSNISLGEGIEIGKNISQVQPSLERNIFDVPTQPVVNEQIRKEEAYQEAKLLYERGESRRVIDTSREPMQVQRMNVNTQAFNASSSGRRIDMINLNQSQPGGDAPQIYEVRRDDSSKEKSNWKVSNDDITRKYSLNE